MEVGALKKSSLALTSLLTAFTICSSGFIYLPIMDFRISLNQYMIHCGTKASAIHVFNFEAPMLVLPLDTPEPLYLARAINRLTSSLSMSSGAIDSRG